MRLGLRRQLGTMMLAMMTAAQHPKVRQPMRSRSARDAIEVVDDQVGPSRASAERADVFAPMASTSKRRTAWLLPLLAAVLARRHRSQVNRTAAPDLG
jgi:hypothetical protein